MSGHVFLLHGDLTRFACDAWLLPTDATLHVTAGWWRPHLEEALIVTGAWCQRRQDPPADPPPSPRVVPCVGVPPDQPRPWLCDVGAARGAPIDWHLGGVREFIAAALADLADGPRPLAHRSRPLLAVPLVGTGHGGKRRRAGEVMEALLSTLRTEVSRHEVDVAVVTYSAADYAAGQAARRNLGARWPELSTSERAQAQTLAKAAALGQLTVFFGAGISAGAGVPTWNALLGQLAGIAGLDADTERQFHRLDHLDRGQYVAQRLREAGDREGIGAHVQRVLAPYQSYALAHGLLASLPVDHAITTNYDQLYEAACAAAGRPVAVLPYAPGGSHDRWLLKMHGCLSRPEHIVLTRENYLRYAERNAALAGIVQAMLITKHMLFIGFSLADDNFLRIVDAVRRAIRPEGGPPVRGRLGTAFMLFQNPLLETLWRGELDWICLDPGVEGEIPDAEWGRRLGEAARRLEIFLDCVGHEASAPAHLLDARFSHVLDPADQALRGLLEPLRGASEEARKSAAWPLVRELLRRLGASAR